MYLRTFEPLRIKYQKKVDAEQAAEKALEFINSSPMATRKAMAVKDGNKRVHFREEEGEQQPIKKVSLILHPPSSPESTLSPLTSSTHTTPRTSTPRSRSIILSSNDNRSPLSPSAGSLSPPKRRVGSASPEKSRSGLIRRATPIVRLDEPKRMQFPSLKAQEMADQENVVNEE